MPAGTAFTPSLSLSTELFRMAAVANGTAICEGSIEPLGGNYIVYSGIGMENGAWMAWLLLGRQ